MSAGLSDALDAADRKRIDAAIGFINDKITRERRRVRELTGLAFIVAGVWWLSGHAEYWQWPALLVVGVWAVTVARSRREIRRWHKGYVVRRIVEAVGPELDYSPESSFTLGQFNAVELFGGTPNAWKSEDQVSGRHRDVAFRIHEVRAARSSGRSEEIIFRGAVLELEFNKHVRGHIIVIPDAEARRLGGALGEADRRGGKRRIPVADAEFERHYTVYSDDDQQAHYVLTPKLMSLVLDARKRLHADLRLALYRDELIVCVPSQTDFFEAGVLGRVTMYDIAGELAAYVSLAHRLIETLELDTRIWTRV